MTSLCVFCGSKSGEDPAYIEAADELGRKMVERGCSLVYGGGSTGMMGAVADAVLGAGGTAIGVVPDGLFGEEHLHRGLSDTRWVDSMSTRKNLMTDLSQGFVVLPGGLGTLDELFELWANRQIGLHPHPIAVLNTNGYYDELVALVKKMHRSGYVDQAHVGMTIVHPTPDALLDALLPTVGHRDSRDG